MVSEISTIDEKEFVFPTATSSIDLAKKGLKKNPIKALIFGAIYLKTVLSYSKYHNPNADMNQLYSNALEMYNGDPKEKKNYREKILSFKNGDWSRIKPDGSVVPKK